MIAMIPASITTLGTTIGLWHGICVKRLNLVLEFFDGLMEATTITTFGKQTTYSISTQGIFTLTFIQNAEVKLLNSSITTIKGKK